MGLETLGSPSILSSHFTRCFWLGPEQVTDTEALSRAMVALVLKVASISWTSLGKQLQQVCSADRDRNHPSPGSWHSHYLMEEMETAHARVKNGYSTWDTLVSLSDMQPAAPLQSVAGVGGGGQQ